MSETLYILHEERFVDQAPQKVYAVLLDDEPYRCSVRAMYRILEENQGVSDRENQLRYPSYKKLDILPTESNQVGSWDIIS